MSRRLAPVALSCGDPAGIGPEIAVKAHRTLAGEVPMVWIGDPRHLPGNAEWQGIDNPSQAGDVPADKLPVLPLDFAEPAEPGKPDGKNASGVIQAIELAVDLTRSGTTSAICTCPISKQVLQEGGGFDFPGHTEFLAHLAGVDRVVMMLASPMLRVVPATIHIPLAEVSQALTPALIRETIAITEAALRQDFGIAQPRVAVAALNPHAGEGGRIGREEVDWLAPLLDSLRQAGSDIIGPLPADTMFHAAARARYDVAIAMYHDQALIPIKALDFDRGVNVTLGLPFVRSSPDHGTAFDIAGQDRADPTSLIHALRMAQDMARGRRN